MYYFLKNKDFKLEDYDFEIECTPKFTKKEQEIFQTFITHFNPNEKYSEFHVRKLKLKESEIKKYIFSLAKKTIYCHVFKENIEITNLYFSIFDVLVIEGDTVIFAFSEEIKANKEIGNFYNRVNILAFLQFKYSYTKELFKLTLKKNNKQDYIEFTIEEIKKLLKIDKDKYHRYYDLEGKVFNLIIDDIEYGGIRLWFEKIKNNDLKNSRVVGVKVHYIHSYHIQVHRDTNEILKIYMNSIEDFAQAYQIVYNYRKLSTLPETMKYVKDNLNTIFKVTAINPTTIN